MLETNTLKNEIVLITGGGTGLGRAMAEYCAKVGATVAIIGRRDEPLKETVQAIEKSGGKAVWESADIREPEQVKAAVDKIEDKIGKITKLVNNAGANFLSPTEELSYNAFDSLIKINLYGTFNVTMDIGKRWIERKYGGAIVSIVTTYSWLGSPFVVPSACSKAGVLALTRSLATEWAYYGIRSNAIAPGMFETEGAFARLLPRFFKNRARKQIPLKRFGKPEEIAVLTAYLLSPVAEFINGECIVIDGGEWLTVGQQMGRLTHYPRVLVKKMMQTLRPNK